MGDVFHRQPIQPRFWVTDAHPDVGAAAFDGFIKPQQMAFLDHDWKLDDMR